MSCEQFEAGQRVECVGGFEVKDNLGGAPISGGVHEISPGDLGEITLRRQAGSLHWLVIKWDRLDGRTLNLNADQFDLVKLAET